MPDEPKDPSLSGAVPPVDNQDDDDSAIELGMDRRLDRLPLDVQEYVRGLRGEAAKKKEKIRARDAELAQERAERDRLARENSELKSKEQKVEEERLLNEKKYEELWRNDRERAAQQSNQLRGALIKETIEKEAIRRGIPVKLLKNIDQNGILIDDTGSVRGVEGTLERFQQEYADVIEGVKLLEAKRSGGADPGQVQGGGREQLAPGSLTKPGEIVPGVLGLGGEGYTAGIGVGKEPAPKPISASPQRPNRAVTKETPIQESRKIWKQELEKLRQADRRY